MRRVGEPITSNVDDIDSQSTAGMRASRRRMQTRLEDVLDAERPQSESFTMRGKSRGGILVVKPSRAALRELLRRKHSAATTIQAQMRGALDRGPGGVIEQQKRVVTLRRESSAIKIQSAARARAARKRVEHLLWNRPKPTPEQAATLIQTRFRILRARRAVNIERDYRQVLLLVEEEQRRAEEARKEEARHYAIENDIEPVPDFDVGSVIERIDVKGQSLKQNSAATKIESLFRGVKGRMTAASRRARRSILQATDDNPLAHSSLGAADGVVFTADAAVVDDDDDDDDERSALPFEKEFAAKQIQSNYRGFVARKRGVIEAAREAQKWKEKEEKEKLALAATQGLVKGAPSKEEKEGEVVETKIAGEDHATSLDVDDDNDDDDDAAEKVEVVKRKQPKARRKKRRTTQPSVAEDDIAIDSGNVSVRQDAQRTRVGRTAMSLGQAEIGL